VDQALTSWLSPGHMRQAAAVAGRGLLAVWSAPAAPRMPARCSPRSTAWSRPAMGTRAGTAGAVHLLRGPPV